MLILLEVIKIGLLIFTIMGLYQVAKNQVKATKVLVQYLKRLVILSEQKKLGVFHESQEN